jgi:hypothetical protein
MATELREFRDGPSEGPPNDLERGVRVALQGGHPGLESRLTGQAGDPGIGSSGERFWCSTLTRGEKCAQSAPSRDILATTQSDSSSLDCRG